MKLTFAEAERYLRDRARGPTDLDLVFLSHLRRMPGRQRDYISNALTAGDLGRLSRARACCSATARSIATTSAAAARATATLCCSTS